jgi:hypothetical protein
VRAPERREARQVVWKKQRLLERDCRMLITNSPTAYTYPFHTDSMLLEAKLISALNNNKEINILVLET